METLDTDIITTFNNILVDAIIHSYPSIDIDKIPEYGYAILESKNKFWITLKQYYIFKYTDDITYIDTYISYLKQYSLFEIYCVLKSIYCLNISCNLIPEII